MNQSTEIGYNTKVEEGPIHTRLDAAVNWFRKNSLWPMPMGLALLQHMARADALLRIAREVPLGALPRTSRGTGSPIHPPGP